MSDDLASRVETHLGLLSPTGRRVAMVLLGEHDRLGFHSATQIAQMADTSDATVIRTVQRLGYSGMIELKAEIARGLAQPTLSQRLEAIDAGTEAGDHLDAVHATQLRALSRLGQSDLRSQIVQASNRINSGRRVHINARGVSVGIADYAAAQLARVGIDARRLGTAAGIVADDLMSVTRDDVVIVISSGDRRRWHDMLYERCSAVGAAIVLITDTQPSPADDAVVIRAGRGDPAGTATHTATVAAIEAIVLLVGAQDRERAITALNQLAHYRELLAD